MHDEDEDGTNENTTGEYEDEDGIGRTIDVQARTTTTTRVLHAWTTNILFFFILFSPSICKTLVIHSNYTTHFY